MKLFDVIKAKVNQKRSKHKTLNKNKNQTQATSTKQIDSDSILIISNYSPTEFNSGKAVTVKVARVSPPSNPSATGTKKRYF